jgi:hypothetical protein
MVFTADYKRFIIEFYFRNRDFFFDGNFSLKFGVHFYLQGNSCAGLRPSLDIKYYADGNSCAPD